MRGLRRRTKSIFATFLLAIAGVPTATETPTLLFSFLFHRLFTRGKRMMHTAEGPNAFTTAMNSAAVDFVIEPSHDHGEEGAP